MGLRLLAGAYRKPKQWSNSRKSKEMLWIWLSNIQAIGLKGSGHVNSYQMQTMGCLQAVRTDVWIPGHIKVFS